MPGGNVQRHVDTKTESKVSGTVVLSWKPTDELLTYASYSRGYKAGGFNLDRAGHAALGRGSAPGRSSPRRRSTICEFDPEINDAFELGAQI